MHRDKRRLRDSMSDSARRFVYSLLLGLLGAMLMSCGDGGSAGVNGTVGRAVNSGDNSVSNAGMSFHRLTPPGLQTTEIPSSRRILTNPAEYADLWRRISEAPVPEVNFDRQVVVLVALGSRPNPGYQVHVHHVLQQRNATVVCYRELEPKPDRDYAAVVVYPFDIVAIPRTDTEIEIRRCPTVP